MAQRVIVSLEDDLDGTKADETVQYALDGVNYEIDLSTKNSDKLRKSLADWISHSRRVGGRKKVGGNQPAKRDPEQTKAIRKWAADAGIEVPSRGRIPEEVIAKWEAAHK